MQTPVNQSMRALLPLKAMRVQQSYLKLTSEEEVLKRGTQEKEEKANTQVFNSEWVPGGSTLTTKATMCAQRSISAKHLFNSRLLQGNFGLAQGALPPLLFQAVPTWSPGRDHVTSLKGTAGFHK